MKRASSRFGLSAFAASMIWLNQGQASGFVDHVTVQGDELIGYNAHDLAIWRYHTTGPIQVEKRPGNTYLVNGTDLVGPDGRLLMRSAKGIDAVRPPDLLSSLATASETWSPATTLVPESLFFTPPVFDTSGNAWTAVQDLAAPNADAGILRSNGLTGTWTTVGTLSVDSGFWLGSSAADLQGDVTFASYGGDTSVEVQAVRYEPATGLSAVQTLYSSTNTGANTFVAADAQGDAIVVADLVNFGAAYWVYSAATKTWSNTTAIDAPLAPAVWATVVSPNLAVSPDRQHIAFVYNAQPGVLGTQSSGIYVNVFDSATKTFGAPISLPNSSEVYTAVNPGDVMPAFIDNSGTVSVLWTNQAHKHRTSNWASRYSNGTWTTVKIKNVIISPDVFNSQAIDAKGDLLFTTQTGTDKGTVQNITVVKYLAGKGWSTSVAASWQGMTATRQRIAWLGTAGKMVEVFLPIPTYYSTPFALSSTIFDGSSWSTPTLVPPGTEVSFLQEIGADINGNVALLYNPEDVTTGAFVTNNYSTFITP